MAFDTLDYIAVSVMDNIDLIIEYNPYSTEIKINKVDILDDTHFGYEDTEEQDEITTVGLIIFKPDRRFLQKIGIYTETDLPIIGLFKHSLNLKKKAIIKQITKDFLDDVEIPITRTFEIVDVMSIGDIRTGRKYYKLSPIRG